MSKLVRSRRLQVAALLLIVVAAIVVVALPAREAEAASNCTYYSSASHTTVVGQFGKDCCNNPVAWGKKSKFAVCGGCFPCVPPPK